MNSQTYTKFVSRLFDVTDAEAIAIIKKLGRDGIDKLEADRFIGDKTDSDFVKSVWGYSEDRGPVVHFC